MKLGMGLGEINFSEFEVGDWARGLASAFISGGAAAVTSGIVVSVKDPSHYAPGTLDFFQLVGSVFLMSGALAAMNFWREKPLPAFKKREETIEETQRTAKGGTVTTTVTDRSVVPIDDPLPSSQAKPKGETP